MTSFLFICSNEEAVKFPETDQPIVVPIRDATGKEVMKGTHPHLDDDDEANYYDS